MKHTPLPWKLITDPNEWAAWDCVEVAPCRYILTEGRSLEEAQANAEFIVKACNAHYDLVEACEDALEALQNDVGEYEGDGLIFGTLRKALKKAKGE